MDKGDESKAVQPAQAAPAAPAQDSVALPGPAIAAPPGPAPPHGHTVHTYKEPNPKKAEFKPQFLCVVYLRFEANQLLTTRYAYVQETDLLNPTKVRTTAIWALAALKDNDPSGFHEGKIYRDLQFISVGQQLILILFVDNNPEHVKFEDTNSLDYLVRFSQLSAIEPDNPIYPVQPNRAFYNLMKFSVPGLTGKEACRIDYWDTIDTGHVSDPLPGETAKYRRYSMNIHLRMAIANPILQPGGHWIPLVVDPDTGNMGGGP
jgi:hypothetical protein